MVLFSLLAGIFLFPAAVRAGSGTLQLTATANPVAKGDMITVVCQVSSEAAFVDTSFRISYNAKILQFISGGEKVTGGDGMLHIASTGNAEETYKKTFSLQFRAKKRGTTLVVPDGAIRVTDKGGDDFSISSNQLTVTVVKRGGTPVPAAVEPTEFPQVTPKPVLSRESREETESREREKSGELTDVGFSIRKTGNQIRIRNSYEFEVLNPDELDSIPSGYIQSSIELSGISVPAFTMEHDLANNYLLLYLKGPKGDKGLYQYDRTEQTIQKYTGTMTERVNKGNSAGGGNLPVSSYVLVGMIAFLVITILCMLIAMLKMAMKKKAWEKDKKNGDGLDF